MNTEVQVSTKKLSRLVKVHSTDSAQLINLVNLVTKPAELWSNNRNGSSELSGKGPPSRIDEALSTVVG